MVLPATKTNDQLLGTTSYVTPEVMSPRAAWRHSMTDNPDVDRLVTAVIVACTLITGRPNYCYIIYLCHAVFVNVFFETEPNPLQQF